MNEHDKQISGVVEAAVNPAPSKGRRRLVKGAMLATPAILTLRTSFASQNSGPSLEKALASLACNENGDFVNTPALLSFLPTATDEEKAQLVCPTTAQTQATQKNKRRRW